MLTDPIIAIIRTLVPTVIGSLITFLAAHQIAVDAETSQAIAAGAVGLVTALYYALATYLERNVNSNFGWLLGMAKAPSYGTAPVEQAPLPENGDIQPEDPPQGE